LAKIFQSEDTLVFNSGYAANQSLVSAVSGKGDTILYDRLSHVCLKEGAWLSKARSFPFTHNDLQDLEAKLQRAEGHIFVLTESIFSMDGDEAPLADMIKLCKQYHANLIVDEAHSTGVMGPQGAGWLVEKGLEQEVFARVYTFGKAMGVHGACVAGSSVLKEYLVNYGRGFIYTTSLPPHSILSIEEAFRFLSENLYLQDQLQGKIALFQSYLTTHSHTAVQPVMIPGNEAARHLSATLQEAGWLVKPILSPTVGEGTERIRICLHAFNEDQDIINMAKTIKQQI
jgi:8-amino-7-oxononanoate synthase